MKCQRTACGRDIPEDALFCPYCGKKQQHTAAPKPRKRANGKGSVYRRGKSWCAQSRIYRGGVLVFERIKGGFPTRAAAEEYLDGYTRTGVAPRSMRLIDCWMALQETKKWQALSKDKRSHYGTAWRRLERIQMQVVGQIPFKVLQELTDAAPGDYYAHRDIKTLLGKLYEVAVTSEALDMAQDKTALIELPPVPDSERDAYTVDEVHGMWMAYRAGDDLARYALILCYTGMRPGELMQLDLSNIDLQRQRIVGGIKTAAGKNREIPIVTAIVPLVAEAMQVATHGLADGCREHFYDRWCPSVERWGGRPHMTAHSCRHTLATAMEAAGVSVLLQKLILGHAVKDITQHYSRHQPFEDKLAAVERATAIFNEDAGS